MIRLIQAIRDKFSQDRYDPAPNSAMVSSTTQRPHPENAIYMRGCRELLSVHADSLPIRSAIDVIERSIPSDPGLAFTHCRGLLETVCRTILTDRGIDTPSNPNANWLMSQTLKVLRLTPDTFDGDARVEEGVQDVIRGLNQLMNGVVSLRNSQGIGPHGKDALESILDSDYAIITAYAADSAAALLYRLHRKQSESDPTTRIQYGDYPDFDAYLDEKYPDIEIEEVPIQASRILYSHELKAYRDRLMVFLEEGLDTRPDEEFGEGEVVGQDANG